MKRLIIISLIIMALVLAATLMLSSSPPCATVTSPNPVSPLEVTDDGINKITFEYDPSGATNFMHPKSYDNYLTDLYPNYNKSGYAHFTIFGDASYSWQHTPKHTYNQNGNFTVFREFTLVKNGGGLPPRKMAEDQISVSCSDISSVTNKNNRLPASFPNNANMHMEWSRPLSCGYDASGSNTSVLIVKLGKYSNTAPLTGTLAVLKFNESHFKVKHIPTLNGITSVLNGTNEYKINGTINPNEEVAVFFEFEPKCTKCKSFESDVSVHDSLGGNQSVAQDVRVLPCGEFDPNWIEIHDEVCPADSCRKLNATGSCFYYTWDYSSSKKVKITYKAKSNNIISLEPTLNTGFSNSPTNDPKVLVYTSYSTSTAPATYFPGGVPTDGTSLLNAIIETGFKINVRALNYGDSLKVEMTSEFDSIPPFTNIIQIPIEECTFDPLDGTIILCPDPVVSVPDTTKTNS